MISDIFLCGDLVVEIQFLSKNIQIVYRLKSIDHKNIKGLILHLRENTGGNCWPILTGLGPLIGDGICGYFVDNKENTRSFGKSTTGLSTGNAQFKLSDG
ncbi:hypothetical protein HME9304_01489 [Flagellimonas maritima]|uniref:Uncharacterized protein n=2 Tax=Flagellimonas maritima TaxID=1383885 RepID=A0A2Z4LT80_9FLAO|nr:hypothetical protein HME9304_01489 [Allomuricauda aurantiaca]